ncbi:MAG: aldehyde dehydrogenase family protein [Deltaproteobacteria bacterium]|nr:MAG: aldehyde dehydrogenase family protein [Deltaproteobacteria bacterium]
MATHTTKTCPVTGDPLGDWPVTAAEDVRAAVERARAAQPAWNDLGLERRLERLDRLSTALRDRLDDFAERISRDTGKPPVEALATELLSVPLFLDHYRRTAPDVLARKPVPNPIPLPGKRAWAGWFPMGVIGIISPWNFPFQLSIIPAISALIGGNTVVLKPSEVTPLTTEVLQELVDAAALPDHVFQIIPGDGSTGAALVEANIDKIFFTGSLATGRKVMRAAAERPIPVELELGGKDAFIVCEDAPLRRAARGAVWGGLLNAGQMCISVERILVVDAVYDRFVSMLEDEVSQVRVGPPDESPDMGAMTFPPQLDTVDRHVKDAVERGARLLAGGRRLRDRGLFYAPTLVADVTPEMAIWREETFGPVLPVIRVRDEAEAIARANDHEFGLTASVWTRDQERGLRIAESLHCGQVMINDVVLGVGNPALPFGGVKGSGIGRYHGPEGLTSFMHRRAIMADRGLLSADPTWYPYAGKYEALRAIIEAFIDRSPLPLFKAGTDAIRSRLGG